MSGVPALVPLDRSTIYPTGVYACRDDRWFPTDSASSWPADSVVLGVFHGDPIPRDFVEMPQHASFSAGLTVPQIDVEAMCAVEATCVWKNLIWIVESIDRRNSEAWLSLPTPSPEVPDGAGPTPRSADLRSWPGITIDADTAMARVRPGEMADVALQLTPFEMAPALRRRDDLKIPGVQVASIPTSPWLPAADALRMARVAMDPERIGAYPVDQLRADRMRDGWRVWAPPPPTDDPLGFRLGWAIWYVADDGVVWRSSTSTEFREASKRMSSQLYQRLQQNRLGPL